MERLKPPPLIDIYGRTLTCVSSDSETIIEREGCQQAFQHVAVEFGGGQLTSIAQFLTQNTTEHPNKHGVMIFDPDLDNIAPTLITLLQEERFAEINEHFRKTGTYRLKHDKQIAEMYEKLWQSIPESQRTLDSLFLLPYFLRNSPTGIADKVICNFPDPDSMDPLHVIKNAMRTLKSQGTIDIITENSRWLKELKEIVRENCYEHNSDYNLAFTILDQTPATEDFGYYRSLYELRFRQGTDIAYHNRRLMQITALQITKKPKTAV